MNISGRRGSAALVTAVALGLVAACGGGGGSGGSGNAGSPSGPQPTGKPIIIGEDLDSTGPGASYSTVAGKTIDLAVQDVNNHGGVLGRPLKIVKENDESDPTKTPAVVQKLAGEGAKMLILQSGGAAVLQAKSTIQKLGIPAIAPTSVTATVAAPPDNDYIYMLANATSDWAKVYCAAFNKAGYHKISVLEDDTTTIAALNKALFAGMNNCVQITREKAGAQASDLSAPIGRIKNQHPDAVLVTTVGGNFEVLAQNTLATTLPKTPRFSLASIGNEPSLWKLANPGALEGLIFMGSISDKNPNTQKLESFLKNANGDSFNTTAFDANGWDTVQLIKTAIEKAGTADDPAKLNTALQSIKNFQASFGQPGFTLSYSATKHLGADGLCGLTLQEFGSDNKPKGPWATYQPPCSS